jgi:hypothetical protein
MNGSNQAEIEQFVTDGGRELVAADPTVFADTERHEIDIEEAELLGTHEYEDVLYTGETEIVDALTGETPGSLKDSVKRARQVVEEHGEEYVAVKRSKEAQAERPQAGPFARTVFYNSSVTGSSEWRVVFSQAIDSAAYEVDYEADYATGTLTIEVERAE